MDHLSVANESQGHYLPIFMPRPVTPVVPIPPIPASNPVEGCRESDDVPLVINPGAASHFDRYPQKDIGGGDRTCRTCTWTEPLALSCIPFLVTGDITLDMNYTVT